MTGDPRARNSLIRATLCAALIAGSPLSHAAEYEVEGTITQTSFTRDGTPGSAEQTQFKVFVRDCSWMIETMESRTMKVAGKDLAFKEVPIRLRRQVGSVDGAELFQIVRSLHVDPPTDAAMVYSNGPPVGNDEASVIGHLWLMFASGCHLGAMKAGDRLTPVYDYAACPYMHMGALTVREARWELVDGRGSLPSKVTYYDDDRLYAGNLSATYSVLSRTNAGFVSVPSSFLFDQQNRFGKPGVHREARATVTAVRSICSRKNLIPTVEQTMWVHEMRLKREPTLAGEVHYSTNRWLSIAEARGMLQQQRDRDGAEYQRIVTNVVRTVPLVDPWDFSGADILRVAAFARKLSDHADPVSEYLWNAFSQPTRRLLLEVTTSAVSRGSIDKPLLSALVPELKKILDGNSFYNQHRFASVELAPDTQRLLAEKPTGDAVRRLNRMLLEDAYPGMIRHSVRTISDPATGMSAVVDYPNEMITFYDRAGTKLSAADVGAHVQTQERAFRVLLSGHDLGSRTGLGSLRFTDDYCTVTVDRAWYRVDVKTGRVEFQGSD